MIHHAISRIELSMNDTTPSEMNTSAVLSASINGPDEMSERLSAPYTPTSNSALRMPSTRDGTAAFLFMLEKRQNFFYELTRSCDSTNIPSRLFVFANSTAAPTLVTRLSFLPEPKAVTLGSFDSSLPHIEPKNTGSAGIRPISNNRIPRAIFQYGQFGCFQLRAEHISGEKDKNVIFLRVVCVSCD